MAKTIKGSKNADTITVNASNVVVATGSKTVKTTITKSGNTKILADKGNDVIYVKSGKNNNLYGGAGKDIFVLGKKGSAVIKDYKAGQDTLKVSNGLITSTKLSGKDVIFNAGNAGLTLAGSANKTISLRDERGSYTVSKSKIKLGQDFSGTMNAAKYLSTVKTIDGRNAIKANITGNAKDNIIYANKRGGTVRGGAGRDTYVLTAFTAKTNLTINQSGSKFGDMDILQLKNVKKSDVKYSLKGTKLIITHKNGGKITVTNWNKRPLSEIQFVGTKTKTITNYDINDKIKNFDYATITKSGTYKATKGNDKFIVSKKSSFNKNAIMKIATAGDTDGPVISQNGNMETINGFPVTKTVVISGLGTEGIDSLDASYFSGWVEFYLEDKDLILPMIENVGDLSSGDDDTITKIILKDFAAKDRIFELKDPSGAPDGSSPPKNLIVNTGKTVQGTTGDDIIFVSKSGQSVFSNGGTYDDVLIKGYNQTKVVFSQKTDFSNVNILNGNFNVVKANGCKSLAVWLDLGSTYNTVIGAAGIGVQVSNNNWLHGSAGDDQLSIYSGTNNTVYGEDGNDHILITANGNKFYGGAGKDTFEITDFWLYNSSHKTDIIYDYKLGADTIQVSNSSIIADRVFSGSDIVLNLRGGGSVTVKGAAAKGINILDFSSNETFNIKNSNYMTITKSGIYNAINGKDVFTVSGDGSKDVTIKGLGTGNDSLDVSYYNASQEFYMENEDLILPMLDANDNVTKITLKDFTVTDQNVKLIDLAGVGYEPEHLIASTGSKVQGTNGSDYIYVTKNGQSVYSNGGWSDKVKINGYNNTTVTFSKDNDGYASVSIDRGNANVIKANGAKSLSVSLNNSSNNTVIGAAGIGVQVSNNNWLHGSAGDDQLSIYSGTNNTVYGEDGNDHILITANGNKFYGGAGKDVFEITDFWLYDSSHKTDIICDYEFGTDTLQVSDSTVIADSVISGTDILLNLSTGGSVKVIGAATNGISILDSSTGKTFNL